MLVVINCNVFFFYLFSNYFNSNIQLYVHVSKLLERKRKMGKIGQFSLTYNLNGLKFALLDNFIHSFYQVLPDSIYTDFVFLCFAVCATDCWDHYGGGGYNPIRLYPTDPDPYSVVYHQEIPHHHLKAYQKTGGNQ